MNLVQRILVWVGRPSYWVELRRPPWSWKVVRLEQGPAVADPDKIELVEWLVPRLRPGQVVDLVYQHHLFRLESFTGLGAADLAGALKLRLKKELMVGVDSLQSLLVPLQTGSRTQCAYAAAPGGLHSKLRTAIEQSGAQMGRVGYAGQLALRALSRRCPAGGWSVIPGVAGTGRLLLAAGQDGMSAAVPFPADGIDLAAEGPEIVKLNLQRGPAVSGPVELADRTTGSGPELAGLPLPAPLSFTLPIFMSEKTWRTPSLHDQQYPFFLAPASWVFLAVSLGLAVYTLQVRSQLASIRASAMTVAHLKKQISELTHQQSLVDNQIKALDALQSSLHELGTEPYDNGSWYTLIASVRDRIAPSLLFEEVSSAYSTISLSSTHHSVDEVLRFVKALHSVLGERALRLGAFSRAPSGRIQWSLQIDRTSSRPPSTSEAGR